MESNGIPEFLSQAAISDADGSSLLSTSTGQPGRHIVARLLKLIARRGGNVAGVLRVNGFDEPLEQFLVATLPTLDIANLQKRGGDWRLLFYCLVGSRTLREAIMRAEELLLAIDGRMGSISLKRAGGKAVLSYTGARSGDEEMDFVVTLHGQLMFHSIFSWLVGKPLEGILALDFPQSAARYLDIELFPFQLRLGADQPEMRFAASLLDQPIIRTMSDCEALPTLNFLFGLRVGEDPLEIVRRSRHFMAMALRDRRKLPSLEQLARHLAIAPMTLRRRLRSAGTSFRVIRNELRYEMAIDMLTNSRLSIEDIAGRLDLCDSDALRRAFRAWTGMAPTEFRRTLEQAKTG
jgi:AraC-like DNA-binding protein